MTNAIRNGCPWKYTNCIRSWVGRRCAKVLIIINNWFLCRSHSNAPMGRSIAYCTNWHSKYDLMYFPPTQWLPWNVPKAAVIFVYCISWIVYELFAHVFTLFHSRLLDWGQWPILVVQVQNNRQKPGTMEFEIYPKDITHSSVSLVWCESDNSMNNSPRWLTSWR